MTKWEYINRVAEDCKMENSELNELGQKGWELVSVISRCVGEGWEYDYIFKRETTHVPGRR